MIVQQRSRSFQKASSIICVAVGSFFLLTTPLSAQEILRKTRVIRGAEFIESVFYKGDEEIARLKFAPDQGNFDPVGEIPDGKVGFIDEFRRTSGEENYRKGQLHGPFKEYYENGKLRMEASYDRGKILWQKEYYADGKLSFEIHYEDAAPFRGQKETGVGKYYYFDGKLRYEFSFTKNSDIGFQKAYTQDGEIRFEARYDKFGQRIP